MTRPQSYSVASPMENLSHGFSTGVRHLEVLRNEPDHRGVVALIPAYNEQRFIGSVVLLTRHYVEQVIVIDDGSADETAAVAEAAGAQVIRMGVNQGKAAALLAGFRAVMKIEGLRAAVLIDGDGQHLPEELPIVVQPVLDDEADLVVGSRFLETRSEIPLWRQVGQHGLTWITNQASGIHLTDSQSGFRALSPRAVKMLAFQSNGSAVESEMQFAVREHNLRVLEVPIRCLYEEPPKRNPFTHALQVIDGILRMVGQARPLLFFGVPASMMLVFGVILGLYALNRAETTQQLELRYLLTSTLSLIVGAVGLSTGVVLHSVRALLIRLVKPHDADARIDDVA